MAVGRMDRPGVAGRIGLPGPVIEHARPLLSVNAWAKLLLTFRGKRAEMP